MQWRTKAATKVPSRNHECKSFGQKVLQSTNYRDQTWNLLLQVVTNEKRLDYTWTQSFPHHFNISYPCPFFDVKDLIPYMLSKICSLVLTFDNSFINSIDKITKTVLVVDKFLIFWSKKVWWCIDGPILYLFSNFGPYTLKKTIMPLVFGFLFFSFILNGFIKLKKTMSTT